MKHIWQMLNAAANGGRPFLLVVLLLLTLGVQGGCASVAPVVKVGLVAPFEGAQREIGYDVIFSARLAVREINAAGGINGTRVALVALDDRADAELAQDAAASLIIDPGIVAVVGHWDEETTAVVSPLYHTAELPFLPAANVLFPPAQLPERFHEAYLAVTPFGETPGPYAGPAYDTFQLLWQALTIAEEKDGEITREGILTSWNGLQYEGLTGTVTVPPANESE